MMIVISEFMDDSAVQSLRADFDVLHDASLVDRAADLHAAMKLADALIVRNRTQVNAALIASAPRLKVVGRLGVGLDNIDTTACSGTRHRGDPRDRRQCGVGRRIRRHDGDDAVAWRLQLIG